MQALYIYIYIYIYSTWVYHTWRSLCREMDSSLFPLDNLSTSSDEIELVKAVYDYLADMQYPEKCTKNQKQTIRWKASQFEVADGELYWKKKYEKINIHVVWYVSYWYCVWRFSMRWSWDIIIMNKDVQVIKNLLVTWHVKFVCKVTRGKACAERWIPACFPLTICLHLVMK